MPEQESWGESEQRGAVLRIADEFIADLAEVHSQKALARIYDQVRLLERFPEMGSPDVRPVLVRRYGAGLRQLVVAPYVIVYQYGGGYVDVLALVYGPAVK